MRSLSYFAVGILLGITLAAAAVGRLSPATSDRLSGLVFGAEDATQPAQEVRSPQRSRTPRTTPQPRPTTSAPRTAEPTRRQPPTSPPSRAAVPVAEVPKRTDSDIESMALRSRQRVTACYQIALARDPAARGTMRAQVSISADGKVTQVEFLTNTIRDDQMTECLEREILGWRFGKAAADYSGVYEFSFAR